MQTKPLQEMIYDQLRREILSGRFSPEVIYSETKLSAELQVSRTPLKDALTRLAHDRYIDILPSKGFRLHAMTGEDVRNTFQLRTAIEGYCALSLCRGRETREGRAALREMRAALEQMGRIAERNGSAEEFLPLDMVFHQRIVAWAENREITELMGTYTYRQQELTRRTLALPGRVPETHREHMAIFRAITEGGTEEICQAVLAHMEGTRVLALGLLADGA